MAVQQLGHCLICEDVKMIYARVEDDGGILMKKKNMILQSRY